MGGRPTAHTHLTHTHTLFSSGYPPPQGTQVVVTPTHTTQAPHAPAHTSPLVMRNHDLSGLRAHHHITPPRPTNLPLCLPPTGWFLVAYAHLCPPPVTAGFAPPYTAPTHTLLPFPTPTPSPRVLPPPRRLTTPSRAHFLFSYATLWLCMVWHSFLTRGIMTVHATLLPLPYYTVHITPFHLPATTYRAYRADLRHACTHHRRCLRFCRGDMTRTRVTSSTA